MPNFIDSKNNKIYYYEWLCQEPKAIIQIAHGLGEHANRYEGLAKFLTNNNYSVVINDHLGHGKTGYTQWNDYKKLGKLGPGGLSSAEDVVEKLSSLIRENSPKTPLVLLGHSWGSLMAQRIMNKENTEYDAIILSGSAYRTFTSMNSGNLNKKYTHAKSIGSEWLSRDTDVQENFYKDPLNFDAKVIQKFGIIDSIKLLGKPKKNLKFKPPLLLMVGENDALGGPSSIKKLSDSYKKRARLTDVTSIIYPNARHEIFNETNKYEVYNDLVTWLDTHFTAVDDIQ